MGIDYLQQFCKKYGETISDYFSEEWAPKCVRMIENVIADESKTDAIELSVLFYLLYIRSISPAFKGVSEEVFLDVCKRHKIPEDAAWVTSLFSFYWILKVP